MFTPARHLRRSVLGCVQHIWGDGEFQHGKLMVTVRADSKLTLGVRGTSTFSFEVPFYAAVRKSARGAGDAHQGDNAADIEAELLAIWKGQRCRICRWRCGRNDFERIDRTQTVVVGGTGFAMNWRANMVCTWAWMWHSVRMIDFLRAVWQVPGSAMKPACIFAHWRRGGRFPVRIHAGLPA